MKMRMKMVVGIVPTVALLVATVGTTTLHADTFERGAPAAAISSGGEEGPTVRVTNNHGRRVVVYLVDSHHRRHLLGRVGPSKSKDLQIPTDLVRDTGTVELKIYPVMPQHGPGVSAFEPAGVKTRELSLESDQVIELYLMPELARSMFGIAAR